MKRKKIGIILLIILIISLTGCVNNDEKNHNSTTNTDKIDYEEKLFNSIVNIYTDSLEFGTGFVYENGYIITNHHVIYNSNDIKVVTYSKDEYSASLVGFNIDYDITVLKIEKQLDFMVLGDSDDVKVGDTITAIGNPDGDLYFSKAKGKVLDLEQELLDKIDKKRNYIWYDGDEISGYSGGPVYDKEGKIIGILNERYNGDLSKYDFDNLCGIIPINRAKIVISNIIDNIK